MNSSGCKNAFVPTIHPVGTGRKFRGQDHMGGYSYMLANQPTSGVRGKINPFPDISNFLSGEKSVLDLGAGYSDFIPTLIEEKLKTKKRDLSNLHALDRHYLPDSNGQINGQVETLTSFIRSYPKNFHGSLIQEVDIRLGDSLLQFDEIVSSSSLTYILKAAPFEECELILDRILRHLKRGGNLRIWQDGSGGWAETFTKLLPYLNDRIEKGSISNYSEPLPDFDVFVATK